MAGRRSFPLLALLLGLLITLPACASTPDPTVMGCAGSSVACLNGPAKVVLSTDRGKVVIAVDGENAPLSGGNFVDLVRGGVYDNTVFHRVVREPSPFVVQGGDPRSSDPQVPPAQYGSGNFIDPTSNAPRFIPLEIKRKGDAEPSYGAPINGARLSDQLALPHRRGAVAMARAQNPNSASAQFYVALSDLPELDGRYAVFGRVVEGMDVIDQIQQGDRLRNAKLLQP